MDPFAHGPAAARGEGEPSRRPGTPARATSLVPERRFQLVGVPVAASVEPGPAGAVARCRVGARRRPPRPRARPRRTGAMPRARRPRAARGSRSAPPGRRGPRRGPRATRRDRPSRRDAGPRWSQLPQVHAHVSMPSQSSPTRPRVASARGLGRVVPSHQHPFPSTIFLAISESGSISLCCRTDRFFGSGGPQSAATVKTTRASRPIICGASTRRGQARRELLWRNGLVRDPPGRAREQSARPRKGGNTWRELLRVFFTYERGRGRGSLRWWFARRGSRI